MAAEPLSLTDDTKLLLIRLVALHESIEHSKTFPHDENHERIVECAKQFERYLKRGNVVFPPEEPPKPPK